MVIFVILTCMFLSWKMGVIALFPNIVAVLIFFGSLGWMSIPIGLTISVIAAIALGIGVDDTIHFLNHYNDTLKKIRDKRESSIETLKHIVRPMILTTISLSAGFILFVLSDMSSQILFGAMTAFTLIICLATDMTFLPSVVMETGLITVWDYMGLKLDKKLVTNIDLFKGMSVREAKIATLMSFTKDLKEDEILFNQGDWGKEMYVILEGSIKIYLDQGPKKIELVLLKEGTSFGEMGLFRGAKRSAGALSADDSKLLVINHESLLRLKKRNPLIAFKLFSNLSALLDESLYKNNLKMFENVIKAKKKEKIFEIGFFRQFKDVFERIHPKFKNKLINICKNIKIDKGLSFEKSLEKKIGWLILINGSINIEIKNGGESCVFAKRKSGDLVCSLSLLNYDNDYNVNLTALEDSNLIILTNDEINLVLKKSTRYVSELTENLVCILSDQVEESNHNLKQVT